MKNNYNKNFKKIKISIWGDGGGRGLENSAAIKLGLVQIINSGVRAADERLDHIVAVGEMKVGALVPEDLLPLAPEVVHHVQPLYVLVPVVQVLHRVALVRAGQYGRVNVAGSTYQALLETFYVNLALKYK